MAAPDQEIILNENNGEVKTTQPTEVDAVPKSTSKKKEEKEKSYSVDEIRKTHAQAYQPWTKEDDDKLELYFCEGKQVKELAEIFGRNEGAINSRIKKLELKEKYEK